MRTLGIVVLPALMLACEVQLSLSAEPIGIRSCVLPASSEAKFRPPAYDAESTLEIIHPLIVIAITDREARVRSRDFVAWMQLDDLVLLDQAEAYYARQIQLAPADVRPLIYRGPARWELGKLDEAEQDFDKAITIAPANAHAYACRASLRSESETRLADALADIERAIKYSPRNWRYLIKKSSILGTLNHCPKALETATDALESARENAICMVGAATTFAKCSNWPEANRLLGAAEQIDGQLALLHWMYATKALADQDVAGAIRHCDRCLGFEPNNPVALVLRAHAFRFQNRIPDMLDDLNRAISAVPRLADGAQTTSTIKRGNGTTRTQPTGLLACCHFLRAVTCQKLQDFDGAHASFREALALDEHNSVFHEAYGYFLRDDKPGAPADYAGALSHVLQAGELIEWKDEYLIESIIDICAALNDADGQAFWERKLQEFNNPPR